MESRVSQFITVREDGIGLGSRRAKDEFTRAGELGGRSEGEGRAI